MDRTVKVTLKAEVSAYVASMLRGAKATSDLGTAASEAGADIDRAMAESEKAATSNTQAFTRMGTVAKGSLAALTVAVGAYGATLIAQGVNANAARETNEAALTAMLGNADTAKRALDEVFNLATETPFQFPDLAEQFKRLVASGIEVEKIIPLMRSYSAAVTALGGDRATLDMVSDAVQDMVTNGTAQADEINRIADQGIPAWQILAESMGRSVSDAKKMISDGLVSSDQAIDALTKGMQSKFGGMLDAVGDDWTRLADKAQGAQRRLAQQLTLPVITVGKEFMREMTTGMNNATAALDGTDWTPITAPLLEVVKVIGSIGDDLDDQDIQGVVTAIGAALQLAATTATTLHSAAQPVTLLLAQAAAAGTPLLTVLSGLVKAFGSLPAPIQTAVVAWLAWTRLRGPIMTFVDGAVAGVTRLATTIQTSTAGITSTTPLMTGAFGQMGSAASRMSSTVGKAGSLLTAAFGGPAGFAVVAAVTAAALATSMWSDTQVQAEAAAQRSAVAIDGIVAALDRQTGKMTEAGRETIAQQLEAQGLSNLLAGLGVSTDEFTTALYGSADAQQTFRQRLVDSANTEAFRTYVRGLGHDLTNVDGVIDQFSKKALGFQNGDKGIFGAGWEAGELRDMTGDAYNALGVLGIFDSQVGSISAAYARWQNEARLARGETTKPAVANVDTLEAEKALAALRQTAARALASFANTKPQSRKSDGRGGSSRRGDDPAVKAAKAEQERIKKQSDAEKKAATDYEKIMRDRAQAAKTAADEAEKAAKDASDAEEQALDKSKRAVDAYVSAQRQRAAIEVTLAAETDPARRAQLSRALADATAYEAAMLVAKADAERTAATAVQQRTTSQALANETVAAAATTQAEYEAASARAAEAQERAAGQIEGASDRLAAATEAAAERASSATADSVADQVESYDEWKARLFKQWEDQKVWSENLIWLSTWASAEMIDAFREGGADLAPILAEIRRGGQVEAQGLSDGFAAAGSDARIALIADWQRLTEALPELSRVFGDDAARTLVNAVYNSQLSVDQIMNGLNVRWANGSWTVNVAANTSAGYNSTVDLVNWVQRQTASLRINPFVDESRLNKYGPVLGGYKFSVPGAADGGAITGPGRKGVDSLPFVLAPGEHVLTASDVDAMGGQSGVYAFRRQLHGQGTPPDISRAVSQSSRAEPRIVQYQRVYYPLPEPSSVASNRALQEVAG